MSPRAPVRSALRQEMAGFRRRFPGPGGPDDPHVARRARILAVTLEVAAAHGVKGATLRTIAARSGIRTASLYSYFPGGKDELVSAALAEGLDDFYRTAAAALRADADAMENLRRLVFAHTRWTLANPLSASAILVLERAHAISPVMDVGAARRIGRLHRGYRHLVGSVLAELGVEEADTERLSELIVVVCDNADLWAPASAAGSDPADLAWLAVRRLAGLC